MSLNNAVYRDRDITVLYVPNEKDLYSKKFEEIEKDARFVKRLESICRFWVKQIRQSIAMPSSSSEFMLINELLSFWEQRCKCNNKKFQASFSLIF